MSVHKPWVFGHDHMTETGFDFLLQAHDYPDQSQKSEWQYFPEPTDHSGASLIVDSKPFATKETVTDSIPAQDFLPSRRVDSTTRASKAHSQHTSMSTHGFQAPQEPQATIFPSQGQGQKQVHYSYWSEISQDEPLFPTQEYQESPWMIGQSFCKAGDLHQQGPEPSNATSAPIEEPNVAPSHEHTSHTQYPFYNEGSLRPDRKEALWYQDEGTPKYSREASETITDLQSEDPCYAKLLYRALKEQPDHMMTLKDLYDWVAGHTNKGKEGTGKGWQNSVRHNLSMNGAFERINVSDTSSLRKGMASYWRLTDEALASGIISTTRYRKEPKRRKQRHGLPAPKRQQSGAKGGQATRNATRLRQAREQLHQQQQEQHAFLHHRTGGHYQHNRPPHPAYSGFTSSPHHSNASSPHFGMIDTYPFQQPSSYFATQDHDLHFLPPALLPPSNPHSPVDFLAQTPPDLPLSYANPAMAPFDCGDLDTSNPFLGSMGGEYASLDELSMIDEFGFVDGFPGL